MNAGAALLVASIGFVGIWRSRTVAPVPGLPLLKLAMLTGVFGASKTGNRRRSPAAFSRRRSITY